MYKLAICDDNPQEVAILKQKVNQYITSRSVQIEVETFTDGVQFFHHHFEGKYDIILLDIYLGRRTGIEIAKAIRKRDKDVIIIFITTSLSHAIESYEVKALNYLLKPVGEEKLFPCLDDCLKLVHKEQEGLIVTSAGKTEFIPVTSIEYLESIGHKVVIHTTYMNFVVYEKLDKLQERLQQDFFIRTKQSFLVNMNFIQSIEGNKIIMKNGDIVTIRHSYIKEVKRFYVKFLLN
ncbi:MAG: LytR/AlgR family response regulator transcription factor [Erysipelotrichaceae bacterium]